MCFSLALTDLENDYKASLIDSKASRWDTPSLEQFAEKLRARVGGWRSAITTLEHRCRLDNHFIVLRFGPEYLKSA